MPGIYNRRYRKKTPRRDINSLSPEKLEELMRTQAHIEGVISGWKQRTGLANLELQEEQKRLQMQLEEKAKFDAATFEKQYTTKQKLEIAKWKRIQQDIDRNPDFSEQEKISVKRAADLQIMGIKPSDLPKTAPWEKGKGIGEVWTDQFGSLIGRKPDGGLQLIQRWDQGPDAQAMKEEQDSLKTQAKLKTDLEKEKRKAVWELMTRGMFIGIDEFGKDKFEKVDIHKAREMVEQLYGEREAKKEWWNQAEEAGMEVVEEDKSLPDQVGYAKTYIQNMRKMYGNFRDMPPEAKDAYRSALDIIREYQRQRK